ncbi:hypothetical protein [Streptomyces coffeae]|uniref:MmpS family membrane protein n=1 Tax=Streptomyces coffeae TaxID=621382 RepID=A0ABS1N7T2_9ACTN|nr:hypothetical protein [Streptomyces coffeae]MBL1096139.1 hypothetical protein [Streptomyces coffeae]
MKEMRPFLLATGLAVTAALLTGCSDDSEEKHKVTYAATGSQPFEVEYDKPGTQNFEDSVKKEFDPKELGPAHGKWTKTVEVTELDGLSLTVSGESTVTCTISVDGKVKQKATSKGAGDTVWCNADGSGINK